VPTVNRVLENSDEMANEREAAAERYLYKVDGLASSRLVDEIESELQNRGIC